MRLLELDLEPGARARRSRRLCWFWRHQAAVPSCSCGAGRGCSGRRRRSRPRPCRRSRPRSRDGPIAARATCRPAGRACGPAARAARRVRRPTLGLVEGELLRVEQRLQPLQPSRPSPRRHLIRPSSAAGRAGPRRIFEREGLRVAHRLDHAQRLLEVRVGLAGEADDEIARDARCPAARRGPARACAR